MPLRRLIPALLACLLAAAAALPLAANGAREGKLRDTITSSKERESQLRDAAARLAELERRVGREIAILQGRLDEAQADLTRSEAALATSRTELAAARKRVTRLRSRLTEVRAKLADVLRARFETPRPDLVTVVVTSEGFGALLDRVDFLKRVQRNDTSVLDEVRAARGEAGRQATQLTRLEARLETETAAVRTRRDALAQMRGALGARQAQLAQARAARLQALRATRADRRRAQRTLDKLIADRERSLKATGPGGPWAIPWAIVQCESGGQNFPPNSATASGYYQITDPTWAGLGGSTQSAYQAPKAEQDRLAAKLWDGGRGARNWVCANLVGYL